MTTLFVAIEKTTVIPATRFLVSERAHESSFRLVYELACNHAHRGAVTLYKCEPLTDEEEAALWAELDARQIVCAHYRPAPGHPDWDATDACPECVKEDAPLQRADYEYDRSKDR